MKDLGWPHVVVILGVLGVIGFLTYQDKDGAAVIGGALALLAAMGFSINKLSEIQQSAATIKEQTNGRMGEFVTLLEQMRRDNVNIVDQHRRDMVAMADKLAAMSPPPIVKEGEQDSANL